MLSSAIQDVATTAYTATAELLIKYGADIEARKAETGETPLHIASKCGQLDMVRLLLEKGADVNAILGMVGTTFFIASASGDLELVRLLHKHGADICIGYPLHAAVEAGHRDLAELLVSMGADVNLRDVYENVPLSLAARNGHTAIAQMLLDNGANVNATSIKECTSLFLSVLFSITKPCSFSYPGVPTPNEETIEGRRHYMPPRRMGTSPSWRPWYKMDVIYR